MFVPVTVFTNNDDKGKETAGDAKKIYHSKVEPNVSKDKVQNKELHHGMESVQESDLI